MRVSVVSLVILAALWTSSLAKLVQFNTTLTAQCASLGCQFTDDIWNDGLTPVDGDEVLINAESNINLAMSSLNLTGISLTTNFTSLSVEHSNITFTTLSLGTNSSLILMNTTVYVQQTLDVYGSSITVGQQSELELPQGATAFYLDSASHLTVTHSSILISHATTWLWGSVTTTDSASVALYGQVAFAGPTSIGSTSLVVLGNVTFAASVMFPAGFHANFVVLTSFTTVTVERELKIESLLTLPANSTFVISSVTAAQLLSTTAAGSIEGEGTLHVSSSYTIIAPEGLRDDGSWTNFQGTIVVSGNNTLLLAYYTINSNFVDMGDADIVLRVGGVQVNSELYFSGEIQAFRYSNTTNHAALTVNRRIVMSRCLTSVDGSLDIVTSIACGAGYPFSVSSDQLDSFRPSANFSGSTSTFGFGVLQASSALFNNTYVSTSEDYEIEGINSGINITFIDCNFFARGTAILVASDIVFAGRTNVTMDVASSIEYSESAVVGGSAIVAMYDGAIFVGTNSAPFTQEPSTYLHLYGTSVFTNAGSALFDGHLGQYESSSLNLNNAEFRGTSTFSSTNYPIFGGQVGFSGGVIAFPGGASFSSLSLGNNTSVEVWGSFVSGPVFVGAGGSLTLKNCTNCVILNNGTTPAVSGSGELFFLSSNVETSYDNSGIYPYSDFQGVVTFGGACVFSPVLFSFYRVNFVLGTSNEAANVVLEAYGVRFYESVNWQGPVELNPAVETYPPLEIFAPVNFTSVDSYSASMNLTSELTSLYGPIRFMNDTEFLAMIWLHNNSMINAPHGLFLADTQVEVGTGTAWIHGNVDNSDGSVIFVAANAAVQIYGNYTGTDGNILYRSLNKEANATSSFNVSDVANLGGTSLWYGVDFVKSNETLQESLTQVPVLEALSIPTQFAHVVAGLPGGLTVPVNATIGAHEGRERVYLNNGYVAPPLSPDTPIYKKWWFWFLIILAICLVLGVVAYFVRNRKRHQYTPLEM